MLSPSKQQMVGWEKFRQTSLYRSQNNSASLYKYMHKCYNVVLSKDREVMSINTSPTPYRRRVVAASVLALLGSAPLLVACGNGNAYDPDRCYSGTIAEPVAETVNNQQNPDRISFNTNTPIGAINNVLADSNRGNIPVSELAGLGESVHITGIELGNFLRDSHGAVMGGDEFTVCMTMNGEGVLLSPVKAPDPIDF